MSTKFLPKRLTKRAFAALVLHVVVFAFLYWLAYGIRSEFSISPEDWLTMWVTMPLVVLIQTLVFYYAGHCHRAWQRVSFSDLLMLLQSATLSWLIIAALDHLFANNFNPPRGVLLGNWGLTIFVLGALRSAGRLSREALSPRPL
jgi:FlaA1/EpsC-like NDP-sugar epimerase